MHYLPCANVLDTRDTTVNKMEKKSFPSWNLQPSEIQTMQNISKIMQYVSEKC